MVNRILKASREKYLLESYPIVMSQLDKVDGAINDSLRISMSDNWYGHPISSKAKTEPYNSLDDSVRKAICLRKEDCWQDTGVMSVRERYEITFLVEGEKKVRELNIVWNPTLSIILRNQILVDKDYRRNGVATHLTNALEIMGEELGAKVVMIDNIIPSSMTYWQSRKDYVVNDRTARKHFS